MKRERKKERNKKERKGIERKRERKKERLGSLELFGLQGFLTDSFGECTIQQKTSLNTSVGILIIRQDLPKRSIQMV